MSFGIKLCFKFPAVGHGPWDIESSESYKRRFTTIMNYFSNKLLPSDISVLNVTSLLLRFVSIAAVLLFAVTVLLILFIILFMNDERKKKIWTRFKRLSESNRYGDTKRCSTSQSNKIQSPADLDDDVTMLHSYLLKRRHGSSRQNDGYGNHNWKENNITPDPIDEISHEVQEWKKIQNDVKMQLTVLNRAVQKLHQEKSQNKIPHLEMVEH
jgi:hypothetical protein